MLVVLSEFSTLASIIKLVALLIVFVLLLFAAHLFTKWYARSTYGNSRTKNIRIVESQQLSPGKNIVIVQIGKKYVSYIQSKDTISVLTELEEDDLDLSPQEIRETSFRDVLKNAKDFNKKNKGNS